LFQKHEQEDIFFLGQSYQDLEKYNELVTMNEIYIRNSKNYDSYFLLLIKDRHNFLGVFLLQTWAGPYLFQPKDHKRSVAIPDRVPG
jgi:hypothetical protein